MTLVFPGEVGPGKVKRLVRSLGGSMDPDELTDALLKRGSARVWVRPADPGVAPVKREKVTFYRETLGDPPDNSVSLEVFKTAESRLLAAELLAAVAAHWPVVVRGLRDR